MIIKGKDYIVETLELSNEDRNFIKICYDYSQRYPFKWNYLKKDIFTNEEIIYFNSVGLSFIDINFANEIYKQAQEMHLGRMVTLAGLNDTDYSIFL